MYFLSALTVYSSVNNLSVISGRFMNLWVKPVLSNPKGYNTLALVGLEQVALQILVLYARRSDVVVNDFVDMLGMEMHTNT